MKKVTINNFLILKVMIYREDNMMKSKNEIDLMFGTRTTFVEFFRFQE